MAVISFRSQDENRKRPPQFDVPKREDRLRPIIAPSSGSSWLELIHFGICESRYHLHHRHVLGRGSSLGMEPPGRSPNQSDQSSNRNWRLMDGKWLSDVGLF